MSEGNNLTVLNILPWLSLNENIFFPIQYGLSFYQFNLVFNGFASS